MQIEYTHNSVCSKALRKFKSSTPKAKRKPAGWEGKIRISDDFDSPLPDIVVLVGSSWCCIEIFYSNCQLQRSDLYVCVDYLMHYAAICRVEKVIRPYLEAIL